MKAFLEPLRELSGFEEMIRVTSKQKGLATITGCIDAQKPHMIYACNNGRKNKVIVTFHEQKAKELWEEYSFFDPNVVYYPAKDVLFYQADIRGNLLTAQRISAIASIFEQESVTLITTFDALMNTMTPPQKIADSVLHLSTGEAIDLEKLQKKLIEMGYEKEYQVETVGQYALRGGILDIFPLTEELPARIELWGDEIDTIRSFDVESQKSIESIASVTIYPAAELVLSEEEKRKGIEAFLAEAKKVSDQLRKEFKTQEAYRIMTTAETLAEEWGELSISAGMDAYLSYFCSERTCLLDYFDPEDTQIFFDELGRCVERGTQTKVQFSESMKQLLAM